jgi:hypothetical protein
MSWGCHEAETTAQSLHWVSATIAKAGHCQEENEDAIRTRRVVAGPQGDRGSACCRQPRRDLGMASRHSGHE